MDGILAGMGYVAVSAVGVDRPGIVAGVTGALVGVGANLEDTAMTVLRGRFVMVLVVAVPDEVGVTGVESALAGPAIELGLVVHVDGLAGAAEGVVTGQELSVTVYGADRPGIVHRVTATLAGRGVNIVEVSTRVLGATGEPVYAMLLDVRLPAGVGVDVLDADLAALADELGVTCHARLVDVDVL